jgi:serine/threonine-protein kinase
MRELEAYFDDPEGYAKEHKKRTIAKLCDLAATARKESRVLDAADDYNSALAYAPDDPQLLKIVVSMQRDAARAHMLKRAAPLALATIVVAGLAYGVTQSLKHHVNPPPVASTSTTASATASATESATVPVVSTSASATTSASTSASAKVTTTATTAATTATATQQHVERAITLTVTGDVVVFKVAVDGREPEDKTTGDTIRVDEREHTVLFSCALDPETHQELCDPQTRKISAGKSDDALSISLHSKPATLIVTGDPAASFGLEDYPQMVIRPGVPIKVDVPKYRYVMLYDRSNPSRKQKVDLKPGQQQSVKF